jgi:hypothetical protein
MKYILVDVTDVPKIIDVNEQRAYLIDVARERARKNPGRKQLVFGLVWEGIAPINGVTEKTHVP